MREIIQRLIKVEEELRKEQLEMHKVLKAKQELIEIQKKRIEYLSANRSSASTNPVKLAQHKPHQHQTLNHSLVASYNNKLKQFSTSNSKLNKTNLEQKDVISNSSNGGITTALNSLLPSTSSPPSSSVSLPITTSSIKLNENISSQIAASPSSSASSMTQFCNYLASNSLNTNTNNSNTNSVKRNYAKLNGNLLLDALSSTSSSSSGLSNSSSLNHLNHQQATSSVNILRHSEL